MATITVTPIKTFVSGETVTPTKLNELAQSTVALTAGTIVDADVSASAAIAAGKLSTAAQQALLPAGAVMPVAMNSAPSGWLAADGTAVSRSTYATLFAAISTTHCVGDGSTTFNLPDLRVYFIRGVGTNSDGVAAGTFATKQAATFASHTHSVTDPGHTHTTAIFPTNTGGPGLNVAGTPVNAVSSGTGASLTGISIQSTGGTETRPANIALLYCIKF